MPDITSPAPVRDPACAGCSYSGTGCRLPRGVKTRFVPGVRKACFATSAGLVPVAAFPSAGRGLAGNRSHLPDTAHPRGPPEGSPRRVDAVRPRCGSKPAFCHRAKNAESGFEGPVPQGPRFPSRRSVSGFSVLRAGRYCPSTPTPTSLLLWRHVQAEFQRGKLPPQQAGACAGRRGASDHSRAGVCIITCSATGGNGNAGRCRAWLADATPPCFCARIGMAGVAHGRQAAKVKTQAAERG